MSLRVEKLRQRSDPLKKDVVCGCLLTGAGAEIVPGEELRV